MAKSKDVRVPARYYLRLDEVLRPQGVDILSIASSVGLSPEKLQEPDALLPFSTVERLVSAALKESGRTDLGLELGKLLSVSAHSIVGFGMLSCANVGQAIRFVSRYFRLVMPTFQLRDTLTPEHAELHFTPTTAMGHECLLFHLELIGSAALRNLHEMFAGARAPCRLQISMLPPPHVARYSELKDVRTSFGSEWGFGTRLRFAASLTAHPLMMFDPNSFKVADERCRALVDQVVGVRQFGEWIAMTLREVGDGLPTLPEIAGMLNMSARSLNRYLEREGTSFREIAGRVNHELACERLATTDMSVTEIAYSLGFNDTSNFTRAFRSREGCSPGVYRARA